MSGSQTARKGLHVQEAQLIGTLPHQGRKGELLEACAVFDELGAATNGRLGVEASTARGGVVQTLSSNTHVVVAMMGTV